MGEEHSISTETEAFKFGRVTSLDVEPTCVGDLPEALFLKSLVISRQIPKLKGNPISGLFDLHEVVLFDVTKVPPLFQNSPIPSGKLQLILDLDNTLVHTKVASAVCSDLRLADWCDYTGEPELYGFSPAASKKEDFYLKLRPFARAFLHLLAPYYELSIYTAGAYDYATAVAKILDPNKDLFGDRVVARTSDSDTSKNFRSLYPKGCTRWIVAFDDRSDVWRDLGHQNVVCASDYSWLEAHGPELRQAYPPLSNHKCFIPSADANSDQDIHLLFAARIFLALHKNFFKDPFVNSVAVLLPKMRATVLGGLKVILQPLGDVTDPAVQTQELLWNEPEYQLQQELLQQRRLFRADHRARSAVTLGATVHTLREAATSGQEGSNTHLTGWWLAVHSSQGPQTDRFKDECRCLGIPCVPVEWLSAVEATWMCLPLDRFTKKRKTSSSSRSTSLNSSNNNVDLWKYYFSNDIGYTLGPTARTPRPQNPKSARPHRGGSSGGFVVWNEVGSFTLGKQFMRQQAELALNKGLRQQQRQQQQRDYLLRQQRDSLMHQSHLWTAEVDMYAHQMNPLECLQQLLPPSG